MRSANTRIRLLEGRVSDPIEGQNGFYVFRRIKVDLITVRHILISYQGAFGINKTLTSAEAKILAESRLRKSRPGTDRIK